MQIAYNISERKEKAEYIVIHTTGNPGKGADARAHFSYWNRGKVGQSADFVVDDKEALQINNYNKFYTWHCGDGKGKFGITNSNSIGIEICINADGDFQKAVDNAVNLVKNLKEKTGISKVVRHYDASRKCCPAEFSADNWAAWELFLQRVNNERSMTMAIDGQTVMKIPDDVYVQEIYPSDFRIHLCDCRKKDVGIKRYFNAGFFSGGDGVTVPIGNLARDGEIITQAKDNESWINVSKKKLTTIYTTTDGRCGVVKTDSLETIPDLKEAVSGVPVIIGGRRIPMEEIKEEGYDGGECYDTWHGFLGIRHGKLCYVAMKSGFNEMCWTMVALGIYDAIKLDGGGSFILHDVKELESTGENRRIHNVGVWTK